MRDSRAQSDKLEAVEAAKAGAKALLDIKLAEAARLREELLAADQKKLEDAAVARQLAEGRVSALQAEMEMLQQSNATALQTAKEEARARESEIRTEAQKAAEVAVAEHIATLEAERRVAESALQARLTAAEAAKASAEQQETALQSQINSLRADKDAEIVKIKEAAAQDAERVRLETAESAAVKFQTTLADKDRAIADANAKVFQTEQKLQTLAQQHEQALTEKLNSQREIMEQAKDAAINAEKAKAFEENQRLSTKVNELQRAVEKKTSEELGEGAEIDLYEALRKEFPDDDITRIAKGAPGADILHVIVLRGQRCGTIIYDSKNHKAYRSEHVSKLRSDQLAATADHAILSTHKFPQGKAQLHLQEGVLLANPARVVSVASMIRQHIVQIHTMRLSGIERERKTETLYSFITSERYAQLVRRVDERASDLLKEQEKEIKWHQNHWTREGEALRAIQKARADLDNAVAALSAQLTTSMRFQKPHSHDQPRLQ